MKVANVERETAVGANVTVNTETALVAASRRRTRSSADRERETCSCMSASHPCSLTALAESSAASVRWSRLSVALAHLARSPARRREIAIWSGTRAHMTATPASAGGPRSRRSMLTARISCSGADQSMQSTPHAEEIRLQSVAIRFAKRPGSTGSEAAQRSAQRQRAAVRALRACTPSCSARQKYWFTMSAWRSVTIGSATTRA